MGSGAWTTTAYLNHSKTTRGFATIDDFMNADMQDLYRSKSLNAVLNPYKIKRECRDSAEHPNTIPVILALDVTGSMGTAAAAIAKQLDDIMSDLYKSITDVEFAVMAIGDLSYDNAPIQMSQFESDIRIAENLEKIYFEGRGGGNKWESYSSAWYMGLHHTDLDCWKRGKKGIIITMGDEGMNPYLPKIQLGCITGDILQSDIETSDLYKDAIEKFDIYHVAIDDNRTSYTRYKDLIEKTWGSQLGDHLKVANCNNLSGVISDIITGSMNKNSYEIHKTKESSDELISW